MGKLLATQNCGEELAFRREGRIRRHLARFTIGLVLINLLWRTVRYALRFPIWGDEAFVAINLLGRDFVGMMVPLEYVQIVPLGFMWTELAVTRVLGLSEWTLRLFPYLSGMLSMGLFWAFARSVLEPRTALLAVAIFGSAYYPVRHGAEIKPYAVDLLVSLVLLSLGWAVYRQPQSRFKWIALVLFAPLAVWFSYPAVFVAGSVGLLLAYRVWRSPDSRGLTPLLWHALPLVASFAVMYRLYGQIQAKAAPWLTEIPMWQLAFPPVERPWRLPLWFLEIHTGNMLAYPVGGRDGGSTATFLLVVIGSIIIWRTCRPLLLVLLGPLPLTFLAAALHRYPYGGSARVSLYMAPAFCLLAGVGLSAVLKAGLPRRRVPAGIRVAALIMAVIAIVGTATDLLYPYKTFADQENRRVIRLLAGRTAPGDQWVVFNALTDLAYAPNLLGWGGLAARFRFYLTRLAPVPIHWAPPPEQVSDLPGGRIWLIAYKDDRIPVQSDLFHPYLHALTERLGKPRRYLFPLSDREVIDLYEFSRRERLPSETDDPLAWKFTNDPVILSKMGNPLPGSVRELDSDYSSPTGG